jgi:hypothetical protein
MVKKKSSISITTPFVDMVQENRVYEWSLFGRNWCAEWGDKNQILCYIIMRLL